MSDCSGILSIFGRLSFCLHGSLRLSGKAGGTPRSWDSPPRFQDIGGVSRRSIERDVEACLRMPTPYGELLQTVQLPTDDGAGFEWTVVHPAALLNAFCELAPAFSHALHERLRLYPSTRERPWRIIWYTDEATCGNLLRQDPTRKTWCIYWSFQELGFELLSREHNWFIGAVIRQKNVENISGGMSCVFKHHMKTFFGDDGFDMSTNGITIPGPRGSTLMWAVLGMTVADEAALKAIWALKGASGMKPCGRCRNMIGLRMGFRLEPTSRLVDLRCSDTSRFILHTNESLWECAERLADPTLRNTDRMEMEKRLGLNHHPDNVLLDVPLRRVVKPADGLVFDFMHCFLVNGVVAMEIHLFLATCRDAGVATYRAVHQFLRVWNWPAAVASPPRSLCNTKHEHASSEAFKGSASDLLNFYPVLRDFVRRVMPDGSVAPQRRSLLALFHVLDGLAIVQRGHMPANWTEALEYWYDAFQRAYPDVDPKPKHHLCLHMGMQLNAHGILPMCFTHERKHKVFKGFAGRVTRLQGFERSVATSLLNAQIRELQDGHCLRTGTFLIGAHTEAGALSAQLGEPDLQVARSASCNTVATSAGDVVILRVDGGKIAARVLLHVGLKSGVHSLATVFTAIEPTWYNEWAETRTQVIVPITDIVGSVIWCMSQRGVRILTPPYEEYDSWLL